MKVLFLHLSDMHFAKSDRYVANRAKKIVQAVCSALHFNEVYIFTSGDIAQSGQKDEYSIAYKFFGSLITEFKKLKAMTPHIYVVPGNHDVNFNGVQRSRSDVVELKNNITDEVVEKEYEKFSEFLKFANLNNCFKDNKEVQIKLIELSDHTVIQVNLVNSALFSLYKDKLKDGDEGVHYISPKSIQLLEKDEKSDLSITVMHHSEEYFSWDIRSELKNILKKETDLLLLGHDHNASTYSVESNLNGNTIIIKGGCFNDGTLVDSTFDSVIYDTQTKEATIYQYDWNDSMHLYSNSREENYILNTSLKNDPEFCFWLESSESALISRGYLDYFVFPRLTVQSDYAQDGEDKKIKDILTIEDFNKAIEQKNLIELIGDDLSGKTTLIKYLYIDLKKKYIPLIISPEDITGKIDRIIRNAYERQYSSDKVSYDAFIQTPKSRKVVLIDDINSIEEKKRHPLLKYLLEQFEIVFYTNNLISDFNIKKTLEYLVENITFNPIKIRIEPFYTDKRKELIEKICKCIQSQSSDKDVEVTVNQVNAFIRNQLRVFSLNPEFIALFTRSFVLNMVDNSNTNAFNAVYEKIGKNSVDITESFAFEVPPKWEICRLESIVEMYTGNSINESDKAKKYIGLSDGYNYIATKDISFNHTVNYDNGVKIPYGEPKFKIAYKGDPLLCIEGGSAGRKIAILSEDVCFVNKLCVFHSFGVNKKYLYYYLQSPQFCELFKKNTSGLIGGVSINTLKSLYFMLPPLSEQLRIVCAVEKVFSYIDEIEKGLN